MSSSTSSTTTTSSSASRPAADPHPHPTPLEAPFRPPTRPPARAGGLSTPASPTPAAPPRPGSAAAAGEARFTGLLGRAWALHEVCEAAAARGGGISDTPAFKDLRARAHAHLAALLAIHNQAGFNAGELAQSDQDLADAYRRSAEALERFHDSGEEDRLRQDQARLKADLATLLSGAC